MEPNYKKNPTQKNIKIKRRETLRQRIWVLIGCMKNFLFLEEWKYKKYT